MILFLTFIIRADKSVDCTISYSPVGRSLKNHPLHYAKPRTHIGTITSSATVPNVIEDDADVDIANVTVVPSDEHVLDATSLPKTKPPKKPTKPKLAPILPAKLLALIHHNEEKIPLDLPCDVAGTPDTC